MNARIYVNALYQNQLVSKFLQFVENSAMVVRERITEIAVPTWMLTQSLSVFRFALPAR